jgi:glycosyltransferase involved in cell wall biosynthesis
VSFPLPAAAREISPHGIFPGAPGSAGGEARALSHRQAHPWRVLHACDRYESISPVVEAQSASGMLPSVVTPGGPVMAASPKPAAAQVSLVQTWNSVRRWRRMLPDSTANCELLHAHCFAAGMAAVRSFPIVVYEIRQFVEDGQKPSKRSRSSRTLIGRSFQTAEQFVIARAAAVVAPTPSLRQELIKRGAAAQHIFVIPRPMPSSGYGLAAGDAHDEQPLYQQISRLDSPGGSFSMLSSVEVDNWQRWLKELVTALHSVSRQIKGLRLYLQADGNCRQEAIKLAAELGPNLQWEVIDRQTAVRRLPACSLVIAGAAMQPGFTPVENPLALGALLAGKALLAADLPCNRDVTPSGSGCLWFQAENAADLQRRLLFLASDPGFCASLGASGARYVRETRSPLRIAEQYDAVYRYALRRRRSGKLRTSAVRWQPSQACI